MGIGSSDEVTIDPSNFINVKEKFESVGFKVESIDNKMDLVLKTLINIKSSTPSIYDQEKQLDDLISLRLKHTMDECNSHFD